MATVSSTAEIIEELDDATLRTLLGAKDEASLTELSEWLAANAKTWTVRVAELVEDPSSFSAEASCEVLGALTRRTAADEETTLKLVKACLVPITTEIDRTLNKVRVKGKRKPGCEPGLQDDPLVRTAVGIVTASRRSKLSNGAINCLAEAGPGGALVLARAFDGVRSASRVQIIRSVRVEDVLLLGDNVVASLASSVDKLTEELLGRELEVAKRFLAELNTVEPSASAEITPTTPLSPGDLVFQATWGAGSVVEADDESVTIDFGNAGKRTLLRAYATLRYAE